MIGITGASGQLGQLVIENLLKLGVEPNKIVAIARKTEKLSDFSKKGVVVRFGDYNDSKSLDEALDGIEKLLLISSSEVGQRLPQHKNVIDVVKRKSHIKQFIYTSLLHADKSPLGLAKEHIQTEKLINEIETPSTILRNGWYSENYIMGIPTVLEHSAVVGCAKEGKISSATRNDYALAAAKVLIEKGHEGKVYELAGDSSYSLNDFAKMIGDQFKKDVIYKNLSQSDYKSVLLEAGLPDEISDMLADSEAGAANGGLYDNSKTLSELIGRPTEPMEITLLNLSR